MEEGNFLEYEVCIVIGGLIGILDLVKREAKYDFQTYSNICKDFFCIFL